MLPVSELMGAPTYYTSADVNQNSIVRGELLSLCVLKLLELYISKLALELHPELGSIYFSFGSTDVVCSKICRRTRFNRMTYTKVVSCKD